MRDIASALVGGNITLITLVVALSQVILSQELESPGSLRDEIDNIGTDDILYELPRAESHGYLDGVWPGIIGISNDFQFRDNLSPKVKDTLCEEEIRFPPYEAPELINILGSRAEMAFHDDVLDDGVVELCAAIAAQDSGSARQGLRLLYKAGEIARDTDAGTVTTGHVRDARTELERGQLEEGLRELTTQGHAVLCAVAMQQVDGQTPAKTEDVYTRYKEIAEVVDLDVLGQRRVRDHLSELSLHGFLSVDERNDGIRGGSYYLYELNVELGAVISVLDDLSRLADVTDQIRTHADRWYVNKHQGLRKWWCVPPG